MLPGALSPEALWDAVAAGRELVSSVPEGRWGMRRADALCDPQDACADRTWSNRGGYVTGFESIWDPNGFAVPATVLEGLDPLVLWTLHAAREALKGEQARSCGMPHELANARASRGPDTPTRARTGAIFGNLGFPTPGMAEYAQGVWTGSGKGDPRNRYVSSGAAQVLADALALDAGSFCLDAACASSLYAIKLACDRLQEGSADLMLAGAVQGADDLFLHIGFSALNALSKSGQSRPFHAGADGLLPAEGAAFVALKRLADARRDGDHIHGVIRGIGLSNDGRGKGLLAPAEEGQQRAMRAAFAVAGLRPDQVSLIECHATGTPVGDATELRSTAAVYAGAVELPIGSLKSNLGHLITTAGAAGLIKVLEALRTRQRPPTLHVEIPNAALAGTPFRVLQALEEWPAGPPRIAAVSAFGFGGNNAHLLVSEESADIVDEPIGTRGDQERPSGSSALPATIAIVGLGCMIASAKDRAAFATELFAGNSLLNFQGEGRIGEIELDLADLRFPPKDLLQALPQQLGLLEVAHAALAETVALPRERTGIFIGMEPDPEVARHGLRWRLANLEQDPARLRAARDRVIPALEAAAVLGSMPNIPANRLSSQFDLAGPGFTVQAGAASGTVAMDLALRALRRGELDAALVGAVDFSCEAVQRSVRDTRPGDAAAAIVLKRLADAERDGDRVYALVDALDVVGAAIAAIVPAAKTFPEREHLAARFGTPYAASGMLEVVAAALRLHHRRHADGSPWLSIEARSLVVLADGPAQPALRLTEAGGSVARRGAGAAHLARPDIVRALSATLPQVGHPPRTETELPRLHCFSGRDRAEVIAQLRERTDAFVGPDLVRTLCLEGRASGHGPDPQEKSPARLVLVATDADLERVKARAIAHLETGAPAGIGVHFAERPVGGEIAFVFAGAGASYAGMGRELLLHLPQLVPALALRSKRLAVALEWAYVSGHAPSAIEQLWGASALAQLHLELSRGVLGLQPDAWLGYSSGETNALFAAGIWTDADELMDESEQSGLMTHELGGEFAAVERCWGGPVEWASWTVLASPEEVRHAIGDSLRVHLAIIQSDEESLIAGDASECARVVERLGAARCVRLDYPLAVHVPELRNVGDRWLGLHRRRTVSDVPGRIYSNALGRAYVPDTDACARAILDQATATLDLRPAILQAWNDGVRVFIEHGPGGSYSRAIRSVLGHRQALVVNLDRKGQGIEGLLNAVAALLAAGVPVDHAALEAALPRVVATPKAGRVLTVPAHAPLLDWVQIRQELAQTTFQVMAPAPRLPPVLAMCVTASELVPGQWVGVESVRTRSEPTRAELTRAEPARAEHTTAEPSVAAVRGSGPCPDAVCPALSHHQSLLGNLARVQQEFVLAQQAAHEQFMGLQQRALEILVGVAASGRVPTLVSELPPQPASEDKDRVHGRSHDDRSPNVRSHDSTPRGPSFSRAQLEVHSGGLISEIFGPGFAPQDQYLRQVRMPLPPLLLADRVVGLDAEPLSMGKGRIWTETDVRDDAWYLQHGHMPAGVMIEAGQADLMLISWLGVDLLNRGERVYRLLGCELTYHGDLPRSGDTLRFQIDLDGHAAQGDVRLMFFHYDCINYRDDDTTARKQLSVRQGQAGFFTDAELAASAGCLWSAETQSIAPAPILDPPVVECGRNSFSREDLEAFARGDAFGCFGPGFERAQTHTRSPAIHQGSMLLLDRITALASAGGPWQRGYLRAELDITPSQWFFDGHFKNDPCMPGTLMFEACLQTLALFLAARGYTLERDGWRFQPVPELPYQLQCRGQVTPRSRLLVTEVFVEEVSAGPVPTVFADLLCTVDGLKAFHARRVGLELVPDWPLAQLETLFPRSESTAHNNDGQVAVVDGFRFDQRSLLACALGRPTQAFGPMYARFDGPQRVARLPSPPYLFASRVASVSGPIGVLKAGARCVIEYDVPPDAWYFDANDGRSMPFAVLLEAALQPCGWLSSYVGSALTIDSELGFRNLDGKGTLHAEVFRGSGTLTTEVELLEVSATAGIIIESFSVRCRLGDREVYSLRTVFGFFPPAALAAQAGLPTSPAQREILERPSDYLFDLHAPATWTTPSALSNPETTDEYGARLRMLDRVDGWWPDAGAAGLGQLRAVKDIDANEWFFKAHFFQDPVQPGSLGIEAMIQLLAFYMLETGMGSGIEHPRFESLTVEREHIWKYRGQVLPHHRRVHTTIEILERGRDPRGAYAVASASLWADGRRIYESPALGLRIVAGESVVTGASGQGPDPLKA